MIQSAQVKEWVVIDTGVASAHDNMKMDIDFLSHLLPDGNPILHFYDWVGDCATYGYFTKPEKYLNISRTEALKLELAKRPTGGGIVFHVCDFAFSVFVPVEHPACSLNSLENYAFVNRMVIKAIRKFQGYDSFPQLLAGEKKTHDDSCSHFCMAKPTKYDVMIQGRKVGGASQRRTKNGFLHQGTISMALLPDSYLERILLPGTHVLEAMHHNSYSLLGPGWTQKQLQKARKEMRQLLEDAFLE